MIDNNDLNDAQNNQTFHLEDRTQAHESGRTFSNNELLRLFAQHQRQLYLQSIKLTKTS